VSLSPEQARAQTEAPVDFNRDIRPILSDACFQCHGPDKSKRKAAVHFDTEDGARVDLGGYFAIVPGKPDQSELLKRVAAGDPARRMPPASSGHAPLQSAQIDRLRRWIAQGAKWQKHWAFLTPHRPKLPLVKNRNWVRNPIDAFVLARLEREGLTPAPPADRSTLLRRVSLDLTGLPPTLAETEAFQKDAAPNAYEKVVERLLHSPRYGERMAQRWLDGARYADTNGYQTDGERVMWRWRDWVIDAFNDNMPFDQFTIEQIAGDLLPSPTLEQRIATGFNRNHRGNSEGGIIPEEYAVEYVVDRVDTTATVWLGLTAACAKCHDHKYDPISQKEFYQLFAYFNNVPEKGKALKYGNSPPTIKAPTRAQQVQQRLLESQLLNADRLFQNLEPELARAQRAWETTVSGPVTWTLERGLLARLLLDGQAGTFPVNGHPALGPGLLGKASYFDGEASLEAGDLGGFGFFDRFSMGAWIKPSGSAGGPILSRMAGTDRAEGYQLVLRDGKIHVNLIKRWLDDAIRVETEARLTPDHWHHVFFTYDGSRLASGIKVYVDGRLAPLKIDLDDLNQSFQTNEPFRIGAGGGHRFHGAIGDVRIYDHVLPPEDVALVANLDSIQAIVSLAPEQRTAAQKYKLRVYFLEKHAPGPIQEAYRKLAKARQEMVQFDDMVPTTMVMAEIPTPRDTHILVRGEYDKKGPKVTLGLPAMLPPLHEGMPNNRLGLARWLVQRSNPLTARVTVNRFWQMLFGTGIVKSVEDFGAQGEWPSHLELLDWLAVEFMDPIWAVGENCCGQGSWNDVKDWDVRHLLKTIVTSATYRQSSTAARELWQKDSDNRLFARGPRFRLSAEMIRDQALAVSGLLVERVGGPSVRPYQPAGLGKELSGTEDEPRDHGPSLYRRSLYTFWKRTVAPPTLMAFDAAHRESCVVRETRTNTPLQALNLMNDVTFVEAARVLAQRVMREGGTSVAERVTYGFRLATGRQPTMREQRYLEAGYEGHYQHFRGNPDAARKLVCVGEYPVDPSLEVKELAAYTAIANMLLNLDEVITKE
ncbi:MAG TPA: DUF1553 domain-containing protein, partial [Gemmataceae bacterium]|nr:DUF1553 domain-containing protein [Gemmataceae bacterium]